MVTLKSELYKLVKSKWSTNKHALESANEILDLIKNLILENDRVYLNWIGTLFKKEIKARDWVNPQTLQPMRYEWRTTVKFKAWKNFKSI